ncbi:MAG: type IV pilus twitching motility protein PilT [Alphaproteobacteria bacterium]|nr:MAG: type IV pilus twitching motility protein PilT [Alphaproteobacteria bacterium]
MDITDLLAYTQHQQASDLHISSGNQALIRLKGDMIAIRTMPPLEPQTIKDMLYSVMNDQQRSKYEAELEIDFSIAFGAEARFRVNAFNTMHGPAAVFRTIPTRVLTLDELNAPPIFYKLTELHKGLILVTGATGSGKSTTLAAMIDHINTHQRRHIITIEDPIEFVHQSKQSLINQREVGASTRSFARALKSSLREDPDIILVGELRDIETIQLALTAAETGHLVMGTLHTNSAPKTIDRIIDIFPTTDKEMARAMLSVSLEGVIAQTLVRKADGSGRVAAHEIMLGTPAVRNLIRESKIPQLYSIIQTGSKFGMKTMKDSLNDLVIKRIITEEEMQGVLATSSDLEDTSKISSTSSTSSNTKFNSNSF